MGVRGREPPWPSGWIEVDSSIYVTFDDRLELCVGEELASDTVEGGREPGDSGRQDRAAGPHRCGSVMRQLCFRAEQTDEHVLVRSPTNHPQERPRPRSDRRLGSAGRRQRSGMSDAGRRLAREDPGVALTPDYDQDPERW